MLVFHWAVNRGTIRPRGNFNHVGYAGHSQALASDTQAPKYFHAGSPLHGPPIDPRMEGGSFKREIVFDPLTLNVNQRALALTKNEMLQAGQWQKIVVVHCYQLEAAMLLPAVPAAAPGPPPRESSRDQCGPRSH